METYLIPWFEGSHPDWGKIADPDLVLLMERDHDVVGGGTGALGEVGSPRQDRNDRLSGWGAYSPLIPLRAFLPRMRFLKRLHTLGPALLCVPGMLMPARGEELDFNRDIRPILSDKCFKCHGPDANHRKADLRLDTLEGALADLGDYAAVVPGAPGKSELIARITTGDEDDVMPPPDTGKTLSDDEKKLFRDWIAQGGEYEAHWAYIPPTRPAVPGVGDRAWPSGANGCSAAKFGQLIGNISAAALSFIVHEPSGIIDVVSDRSRASSFLR